MREPSSTSNSMQVVPATHALVVVPAIGSMVLLFVVVGLAAVAVGAMTGLAGGHGATRHGRRA